MRGMDRDLVRALRKSRPWWMDPHIGGIETYYVISGDGVWR